MVIYRFLKFLIQYLALAIFLLAVGGFWVLLYFDADFFISVGENWHALHSDSLYLVEPVISRYIQPVANIFTKQDLWLDVVVPYFLLEKTYIALIVAAAVSLPTYIFFRLLPS